MLEPERVLLKLAGHLTEAGGLDLKECLRTGLWFRPEKGAPLVGKTKRRKGTKIMGIADGHGLALAPRAESASPAEVKLAEPALEEWIVAEVPG